MNYITEYNDALQRGEIPAVTRQGGICAACRGFEQAR
jgi:hypothetical protein